MFHVGSWSAFTSLDEANNFLDLPTNISTLERRRELVDLAINYRTPE